MTEDPPATASSAIIANAAAIIHRPVSFARPGVNGRQTRADDRNNRFIASTIPENAARHRLERSGLLPRKIPVAFVASKPEEF
jgi:hypothetical protein